MKRIGRIVLVIVILLMAGGVAGRLYLSSRQVADKVAHQLEQSYGGTVEVQKVDLGLRASSVDGLVLFEKDGTTPWLRADRVDTDLTLLGVIRGETQPATVRIVGAKALVRFDRDGKLLTSLPDALFSGGSETSSPDAIPAVTITSAEITVRQEGRPDFVLSKIEGSLNNLANQLNVSVKVDDPQWGKWALGADIKEGTSQIRANLKSERPVQINETLLERLPLIPPHSLQEVRVIRGDVGVDGTVAYDLKSKKLLYRVEMKPANIDLTIKSAEVTAHHARGDVLVEDGHILLRDMQAEVLQGTVRAEGKIALGADSMQIELPLVEASGLDVSRIPRSWKFPRQITGKLNGNASLKVVWTPQKVHTEGTGKGEIVDAKVGSQRVSGPIVMELRAGEDGFHFASPDDKVARLIEDEQKKQNEPSYLNINLKMDDVDLGKFEQEMNVKLPFPAQGKVSFNVKAAIPLDDSRDLKKYQLHGTARLINFVLGELKLESLEGEIDFAGGVLSMPSLTARLPAIATGKTGPGGTITGSARFPIEPLGDLEATMNLYRIPAGQIARLGGTSEPFDGDVSGSLHAHVHGASLADSKTWQARALLRSERLAAFGWTMSGTTAALRLANGEVSLTEFRATLEGAEIDAQAKLGISAPFTFSAGGKIKNADLSALDRLSPQWRIPFSLAGKLDSRIEVSGSVDPLQIKVSGHSDVANLLIEQLSLPTVGLDWDLNPDRINISHLESHALGGTAKGSAVIPLRPEVEGRFNVEMRDFQAAALAKAMPVKIEGVLAGNINGTIDASQAGEERALRVDADINAAELRVQNIPADHVKASLQYRNGMVQYKVAANLLGGTLALDGGVPSPVGGTGRLAPRTAALKGHLMIRDVQIHQLLGSLGGEAAQDFHGRFGLEMSFAQDAKSTWPVGVGRLRVANLRYKETPLAPLIEGDLALTNDAIELRNLSSQFGDGTIRAQARLYPKNIAQSWFSVDLDDVEAEHIVGPWLGDELSGRMQARIRGKLGSEISGKAEIEMARARVFGLGVTDWNLPISFRYAPAEARGEVTISETIAQVGRGRLSGKTTLTWDYTMRVEGRVELIQADLQTLLQGSQVVGGLMTARFDFTGNQMRSLDDLTGSLNASFEQAQAFSAPVLNEVSPLIGMGPSTTFQKGTMRARLDKGFFHIQALALEATYYQVFIEGRVSLRGALDLDVTANTGNLGIGTPRLRMLGLKVPLTGPVPISVFQEAASLLGNRVIHVHVGGTIRSPSYRVSVAAIFTQEAVRFFLTRQLSPLSSLP